MPIIVAYALFKVLLAAHAVRSGRAWPWLWIIIAVPFIGCLSYLLIELVPGFPKGRAARRAARAAGAAAAPGREYRRLLREAELAPTVENRSRLAEECLRLGRAAEAVSLYEGCATSPHATDRKLLTGLAAARLAAGDGAGAVAALDATRAHFPGFYRTDVHLLYARALEAAGRDEEARREYAGLCGSHPGEEARCRYALFLQRTGDGEAAEALFRAILRHAELRGAAYRGEQEPWVGIARRALA